MKPCRNSGLTLIELLVVLAVIGVLATILVPVFSVRRAHTTSSCLFNLKQVGLALRSYTLDYDETLPKGDYCVAPNASPTNSGTTGCFGPTYGQRVNQYKWEAYVIPYANSLDVFFCPDRKAQAVASPHWKNDGEIYYGYAINLSLTGYIIGNTSYANSFLGSGAVSALKTPGQTLLVMESANPTTSCYYPRGGNFNYTPSGQAIETVYPVAYREVWNYLLTVLKKPVNTDFAPHDGGFNFLYADGHIKYMTVGDFLNQCPTAADYFASTAPAFGGASSMSGAGSPGNFNEGGKVGVKGDWPLWGLSNN